MRHRPAPAAIHWHCRGIAGGDRHVAAEPENAELVDPGVIARLGRTGVGDVGKLRSGERVERPTLRTVLARGGGARQRTTAFAAVEAGEMAARQRCPEDAVAVDVTPARAISGKR